MSTLNIDAKEFFCPYSTEKSENTDGNGLQWGSGREQLKPVEVLLQLHATPRAVATTPNCPYCVCHHIEPVAEPS